MKCDGVTCSEVRWQKHGIMLRWGEVKCSEVRLDGVHEVG